MLKSFPRWMLLSLFALQVSISLAWAQTGPALSQAASTALPKNVQLSGKTIDGATFDLKQHKGKVVLLMFWATDCAVCRDKMPELRENAKGWLGKPFITVLVSADRRLSDVQSYNAIINKTVPVKERLTELWALDPSYKDSLATPEMIQKRISSTLPLTLVINKKGDVVKRYQGRVPAEVWDDIADLL